MFANKILDYKVDGETNRELLAKTNFDIKFFDSKKSKSEDTLYLSTNINYLVKKRQEVLDCKDVQMHEIDITAGTKQGAQKLREVISKINHDIEDRYPMQYNNNSQKFLIKTAMFLGIL